MKTLLDDMAGRFWSSVDVGLASDCWEWQGAVDERRYGQFVVWEKRLRLHAHRIAYSLYYDRDIPPTLVVVQTCGNLRCCNPAHLMLVGRTEQIRFK